MSQEFLNLILAISLIIITAKWGGYISRRFGQPAVLGELLVGLLLGPTVLHLFNNWPLFAADHLLLESLSQMAELGIILLMMLAGLELQLAELLKSGKIAAISGTMGAVVPVILGYWVAVLSGLGFAESLFSDWFFAIVLTLVAIASKMETMPLMPSLSDFFRQPEEHHRTIFTVVDSEEWVNRLTAVTEELVGSLEDGDNGLLFVLPVLRSVGLMGGQNRAKQRGS